MLPAACDANRGRLYLGAGARHVFVGQDAAQFLVRGFWRKPPDSSQNTSIQTPFRESQLLAKQVSKPCPKLDFQSCFPFLPNQTAGLDENVFSFLERPCRVVSSLVSPKF
jgi:hypothetical protein